MNAWIVAPAPIRSLPPPTLRDGVGVVFTGSIELTLASRKLPTTLIVLGVAPLTTMVTPRVVCSEQNVKVPAGVRMSVPPFLTTDWP